MLTRAAIALALLAGSARADVPPAKQPATPAPQPAGAPPSNPPAPPVAPPAGTPPAGPPPADAPPADAPPADPPPAHAPPADPPPVEAKPLRRGVVKPPAEMIRENSRLLDLAREAREAARVGSCKVARELAKQVRAIDETFHDRIFSYDPVIGTCLNPEAFPRYEMVLREVHADPPASGTRILGEVFLGMVTGAGGAIVGALLGGGMCIGGGDDGDCDASAIGGAYAGAILTIPFGVRAAGNSGDQVGSMKMTYLGTAIGGLGGLLMLANGRDNITALGLICAPTLGAVIGFNTTRRYKPRRVRVRVQVSGSLIDWSDGRAALGVPFVTRARTDERTGTVTSIPLLGGTF